VICLSLVCSNSAGGSPPHALCGRLWLCQSTRARCEMRAASAHTAEGPLDAVRLKVCAHVLDRLSLCTHPKRLRYNRRLNGIGLKPWILAAAITDLLISRGVCWGTGSRRAPQRGAVPMPCALGSGSGPGTGSSSPSYQDKPDEFAGPELRPRMGSESMHEKWTPRGAEL